MKRRDFLRTVGAGAAAMALGSAGLRAADKSSKPNILFMVVLSQDILEFARVFSRKLKKTKESACKLEKARKNREMMQNFMRQEQPLFKAVKFYEL